MATGHGVTFDGITPTTGVHWGWLLVLSSVFKVIRTNDPETLFRIAGVAYFLCLLGTGCLIARRHPLTAVFLVAYLANRGHWDMETHLVLLTLALLYAYPAAICGLLVVLARTDMVIFALVFAFLTWRWTVAWGALIGFVVVCWLNYWVDGNVVSVSAQIKSAGFNDPATIYRTVGHLALYYPVLPIVGVLAVFHLVVQPKIDYEKGLAAGFIASLVLLSVHILHNSMTEGWYLAPLFLTSLLCSSYVPVVALGNKITWVHRPL